MKSVSFILFLAAATMVSTSCQPPKQGAYEAPARGNEGELILGDPTEKIDSSVEKAIIKDSLKKREYHL